LVQPPLESFSQIDETLKHKSASGLCWTDYDQIGDTD